MPASSTSHDASMPRTGVLTAWLCATLGLGCPGAQVRPPEPDEDCPREARQAMTRDLHLDDRSSFMAIVDIRQPGEQSEVGVYQDGPVVGRINKERYGLQQLPEGTLLHGRLWTGPGIYEQYSDGPVPGILGRYTRVVLPDGRSYPVCIVLGNRDGRVPKDPGSTPEAALMGRSMPMSAVWRWP